MTGGTAAIDLGSPLSKGAWLRDTLTTGTLAEAEQSLFDQGIEARSNRQREGGFHVPRVSDRSN